MSVSVHTHTVSRAVKYGYMCLPPPCLRTHTSHTYIQGFKPMAPLQSPDRVLAHYQSEVFGNQSCVVLGGETLSLSLSLDKMRANRRRKATLSCLLDSDRDNSQRLSSAHRTPEFFWMRLFFSLCHSSDIAGILRQNSRVITAVIMGLNFFVDMGPGGM